MGKGKKKGSSKRSWEDEWESRPSEKPVVSVVLPSSACEAAIVPPAVQGSTGTADGHAAKAEPLLVTTLLEDGEGDSMVAATPMLTVAECEAWILWGEKTGFQLEKHARTSQIAHRDNWRLAVHSEEVAAAIFARLQPWIPGEVAGRRACGCNPNIRLYKYERGQRFGPHVDQANRMADGSITEFTVLIYLNDQGVEGGETTFYFSHAAAPNGDKCRFRPRKGACLVHAHGMRCLTHEGAEVTRGTKYLLRTDVSFR